MKYAICVAAISLALLMPAHAAEPLKLSLSANEDNVILTALRLFDGRQEIVKNAMGQDQAVVVPYDLDNGERLTIAHDISVLTAALDEFRASVKAVPAKANDLAEVKRSIELLSIDPALIKVSANPYPPSLLAALGPICGGCVGVVASKTPAAK